MELRINHVRIKRSRPVIFLHLSVILSTGGVCVSQHALGRGVCVSQYALGRVRVCIPACTGGCIAACTGRGCLPHPLWADTPPSRDGHCSGRYASYWNAFFFLICTDVDECGNSDGNNCNENADCFNTYGSYLCTCNSGKGDSARKISARSFSFKFNTNKV